MLLNASLVKLPVPIYVYGSATLVRALLAADLVDELLLTIEPEDDLRRGREGRSRSRSSRQPGQAPARRCAVMRVHGTVARALATPPRGLRMRS